MHHRQSPYAYPLHSVKDAERKEIVLRTNSHSLFTRHYPPAPRQHPDSCRLPEKKPPDQPRRHAAALDLGLEQGLTAGFLDRSWWWGACCVSRLRVGQTVMSSERCGCEDGGRGQANVVRRTYI